MYVCMYVYIYNYMYIFYFIIYFSIYKKNTNTGSVKALQRPSSMAPQIRNKINIR